MILRGKGKGKGFLGKGFLGFPNRCWKKLAFNSMVKKNSD
jgi:hypothetical protein